MGQAFLPRCGELFRAEKSNADAAQFFVVRHAADRRIRFVGKFRVLLQGQRSEVIGDQFERAGFSEKRDRRGRRLRCQRVVEIPKRVSELFEFGDDFFRGQRAGQCDLAERVPVACQRDESGDAAVRMVRRALAVHLPGNGMDRFKRCADFPPLLPQRAQIVARFAFRLFMQIRAQKSGAAKQNRFDGIRRFAELLQTAALAQQQHRQRVAAIAQCLCDRLKQRGIATMCGGGLQESFRLQACPEFRCFPEQRGYRVNGHLAQRNKASSGFGDCGFAARALQRFL